MANTKSKPEAEVEDEAVEIASTAGATGFSPEQWASINDELQSASSLGEIQYLKEGRTRIRLLPYQAKGPQELYHEVERTYQGQKRTKYMIPCIVWVKDPKNGAGEEPAMKALVVPKTVLRMILSLLAEGYDLFSENEGHSLAITKNPGSPPTFAVVPSPRPVMIPIVEPLKESLEVLGQKLTERDEQREKNPRSNRDRAADAKGPEEDGEDW